MARLRSIHTVKKIATLGAASLMSLSLSAGFASVALAAEGGAAEGQSGQSSPAAQTEVAKLGPTVTKTDRGPTGYEVTFRYKAPEGVKSVQLYGEWTFSQPGSIKTLGGGDGRIPALWKKGDVPAAPWKILEMNKVAGGIWELKVPLPSGTFSYAFGHGCSQLDADANTCKRHPDPANLNVSADLPSFSRQNMSQVYVPQNPKYPTYNNAYQRPRPAEQMGRFVHASYKTSYSMSPAGSHPLSIYLPKGYDPNRAKPYPVLYLSHGVGGNDTDWFTQGAAPYILENAIADGKAEPTILVATNFNHLGADSLIVSSAYAKDMVENVIPYVQANFNASDDPSLRAFGGLSLGGARGIELLTKHPGVFDYYGLWSAGTLTTDFAETDRRAIGQLKGAIHTGAGLQDYLVSIGKNSLLRADSFRRAGARVVEFDQPGIHSWDIWRAELNDYLRRVAFK